MVRKRIYHVFEKMHCSRFFEIFRENTPSGVKIAEISEDPIFLRYVATYHISGSFLTLFRIPRSYDKKKFLPFLKIVDVFTFQKSQDGSSYGGCGNGIVEYFKNDLRRNCYEGSICLKRRIY